MDKTWSKSSVIELIDIYCLPIDDPRDYNKSQLSAMIFETLNDTEIVWNNQYPDIHSTEDLTKLLSNPKDNFELNYKDKQEMIQRAKRILHYCRNGFVLSGTNYLSVEDVYHEGLIVTEHCDIPTCRRAISELNQDQKIRQKIEIKLSQKVKKNLELKKINKSELNNKLEIGTGFFRLDFS
jgi:hypothetical protein